MASRNCQFVFTIGVICVICGCLDLIQLDVTNRRLHLHVSEEELATRRAAWRPPSRHFERGFGALYAAHVTQAEQGCDFDFLHAGAETPEPEIH